MNEKFKTILMTSLSTSLVAIALNPRLNSVNAFDVGYFVQNGSAGMAEHEARRNGTLPVPTPHPKGEVMRANDTRPSGQVVKTGCPEPSPSQLLPQDEAIQPVPQPAPMPIAQSSAMPSRNPEPYARESPNDGPPADPSARAIWQAGKLSYPQSKSAVLSRFPQPKEISFGSSGTRQFWGGVTGWEPTRYAVRLQNGQSIVFSLAEDEQTITSYDIQ
ncbi:MAG: hypothetical protein KME43_21300 [Myxacorys chilensis ATA2-1-KO14]|nr:hypothetical protein [Myxacorys chilensis ATA2-1-KO14]